MRKEIVPQSSQSPHAPAHVWLDLESRASVRLTSENPERPIESALHELNGKGWQSAQPGPQTIWFDFDVPQSLREIHVRFVATEQRTQEFSLLWSGDGGVSYREIVRQQFNFSPETSTEEEKYAVHLANVTNLKLTIVPDISAADTRATLQSFRIR